jgi:hypothetical protein
MKVIKISKADGVYLSRLCISFFHYIIIDIQKIELYAILFDILIKVYFQGWTNLLKKKGSSEIQSSFIIIINKGINVMKNHLLYLNN